MNENERKEEKGDRDSGKKLVESRYDAIDAMENAFKYTNPRRIAWRREVLKRYKDGGLFIHFHSVVGAAPTDGPNAVRFISSLVIP